MAHLQANSLSPPHTRAAYRPDIDGLRAVAIFMVLLRHSGAQAFHGAFIGVDIFFVISGFLIGRGIWSDLRENRFSFLHFYERRIRRIFPPLYATFILCWIVNFLFLLPEEFNDFSQSLKYASIFIYNPALTSGFDYFAQELLFLNPLMHIWSLTIEEEFYLLMPILVYLSNRLLNRWAIIGPTLFMVGSFILNLVLIKYYPAANFFFLLSRAWEFLFGVLLAFREPRVVDRPLAEAISWASAALLIFCTLTYDSRTPYPGAYALLPCIGATGLIYAGINQNTLISRFLSLPPIRWFGLISYSLYLIQWPVIVFSRHLAIQNPTLTEYMVIVLVSVILAALSRELIEKPFLYPKRPMRRGYLFAIAAVVTLTAYVVGAEGARFNQLLHRAAMPRPEEEARTWNAEDCFLFPGKHSLWNQTSCSLTPGRGENVLLWGDSFAAHYRPGISASAERFSKNIILYSAPGCPPLFEYESYNFPHCSSFNREVLSLVKKYNIKKVILASRWSAFEKLDLELLRKTIDTLKKSQLEVWVIGQSPQFSTRVVEIAYRKSKGTDGADAWPTNSKEGINEILRQSSVGAEFIDPLEYFCDGSGCLYRKNGKFLYSDSAHFTEFGSTIAVAAYFPFFIR